MSQSSSKPPPPSLASPFSKHHIENISDMDVNDILRDLSDVDLIFDNQNKENPFIKLKKKHNVFQVIVNTDAPFSKYTEKPDKRVTKNDEKPASEHDKYEIILKHNENQIQIAKTEIENAKDACIAIYEILYNLEGTNNDFYVSPEQFKEDIHTNIEKSMTDTLTATLQDLSSIDPNSKSK